MTPPDPLREENLFILAPRSFSDGYPGDDNCIFGEAEKRYYCFTKEELSNFIHEESKRVAVEELEKLLYGKIVMYRVSPKSYTIAELQDKYKIWYELPTQMEFVDWLEDK
jgi:hypothetical protein